MDAHGKLLLHLEYRAAIIMHKLKESLKIVVMENGYSYNICFPLYVVHLYQVFISGKVGSFYIWVSARQRFLLSAT